MRADGVQFMIIYNIIYYWFMYLFKKSSLNAFELASNSNLNEQT